MGRRTAPCVLALTGVLALGIVPAAHAGQVLRVDGSKVTRANDPSVPAPGAADAGVPSRLAQPGNAGASAAAAGKKPPKSKKPKPSRGQKAVASAISTALKKRQITRALARTYTSQYGLARSRRAKLKGQRGRELGDVIATVEAIALRKQLTGDRMKPVFLILSRNTQFWLRSPFPKSRGYVQFRGSQLLFEYYQGEGLQLQPLANFKKANALHGACAKPVAGVPCNRAALARLLDEMVATRVKRGKFSAWEYYFSFGGGNPPWISGMATATGIQAFGRAGQLLNTTRWAPYVKAAYPAFTTPSPTGVMTRGPLGGVHYLQYSFAPRLYIINAFLQSVIGLYDYAQITGDKTAGYLWRRAEPEARAELPYNDIGDWSTYNFRGHESSREYYDLLLEFTTDLCHRLQVDTYCTTTKHFRDYLTKPAVLTFTGPAAATAQQPTTVTFAVNKLSAVQLVIRDQDGRVSTDQTKTFKRGTGSFTWKPGAAGTYDVSLAAKELRTGKGLRTRTTASIESQ